MNHGESGVTVSGHCAHMILVHFQQQTVQVMTNVLLSHGESRHIKHALKFYLGQFKNRKLSGSSSTLGKCSAGSVDNVKWLAPLRTMQPIALKHQFYWPHFVPPSARQMSESFLAGTVICPGWSTWTGVIRPTSSTSIFVPVKTRVLSSATSSTLENTGIVCFFSTTPAILCNGVSRDSRLNSQVSCLPLSFLLAGRMNVVFRSLAIS